MPTHRESAAGSTDDFYRHKLQSVIFIQLFYLSANGGEGRGFDVLGITHSTFTEYLNLDSDLMSVSDMAQICTFRHHANILKCLPPSPAIMALQHSDTKMGDSALCQLFF